PEIRAGGEERRPANLDWLGALLATAGLALLTLALYAATPEQSPVGEGVIWQLPLAALCFVLFVWHERRTPHPLINVRRFRDSSFTGSALTNAIAGAGLLVALASIPGVADAGSWWHASIGGGLCVTDRHAAGRHAGRVFAGGRLQSVGISPGDGPSHPSPARLEPELRYPVRDLRAEGEAGDLRRISPHLSRHRHRAIHRRLA